jgi:hypothetical protein
MCFSSTTCEHIYAKSENGWKQMVCDGTVLSPKSSEVGCLSEQVLHILFEMFYFMMPSVAKVILCQYWINE